MKRIVIILGVCFILFTYSCTEIESHGIFSIHQNLDDEDIHFLVIKGENTSYHFDMSVKLDLKTLKNLGEYIVDKSNAYGKYDMDGSAYLNKLAGVDIRSFQVIKNSVYAKDKHNIYTSHYGQIRNVDIESFEVINNSNSEALAKDKYNYYFWDEVINN